MLLTFISVQNVFEVHINKCKAGIGQGKSMVHNMLMVPYILLSSICPVLYIAILI